MKDKIKKKVYWAFFYPFWLKYFFTRKKCSVKNNLYSIGIVTFLDRYELFFKNLINKLFKLFPDTEIIVQVNGNIREKEQIEYLNKIKTYIKKFPNVKLETYLTPIGLSLLWNKIIESSASEKIFLLNDDLNLLPGFRKDIEKSGILNEDFAMINKSFSHFLTSKCIYKKIGGFDEGFIEIGGEDDDYLIRLAFEGIYPKSFRLKSIINYSRKSQSTSYGFKALPDFRYSKKNLEYLYQKYIVSEINSLDSVFVRGKYWKRRNEYRFNGTNK